MDWDEEKEIERIKKENEEEKERLMSGNKSNNSYT